MQKVTFSWRNFCELSLQELYAVLKLRSEVFVVEQKCVYLDLDDHDQDARHLLVTDKGALVAYLRVQPPTEHHQSAEIQRLVVDPRFRNKGLGHRVISEALEQIHQTFGQIEVEASAQTNLEKFYQDHGFERASEDYCDHGIPHFKVRRAGEPTPRNEQKD